MSKTITLEAKSRDVIGKQVQGLRRAGYVPIILYGPTIEAMPLTVEARELRDVLAEAGGTTIIELHVGKKSYPTLARSVQRHILKDSILHADFYHVAMDRVIRAEVQVIAVGESPAVADGEGVLVHVITALEIEALPANLVPHLEIDVSGLEEIGDMIHVRDLEAPPGVTIIGNPDEVVLKVDYMAALIEEEVPEEELLVEERAADEVEVIGKGKEEEEEEE
jgi:large subunit ribosomal protein L25